MHADTMLATGTPVIAYTTGVIATTPGNGTPAIMQLDGHPGLFRRVEAYEAVIPVVTVAGGQPAGLTERQLEVLRLVATGLDNEDIAIKLGMAADTVKTHVRRITHKLGARNRVDLVVRAHVRGIVRIATTGAVVETLDDAPQPVTLPELTPREERLLALVEEGLTNAQIAQRLFYSPRSVPRMITQLLNRIGLTREQVIQFCPSGRHDEEAASA